MSNRGLLWRESLRRRLGDERIEITDGELLVLMACNLVTTVGLAGDIARHLQTPGDLQGDFLSSWHLVLYGGVMAVAVWPPGSWMMPPLVGLVAGVSLSPMVLVLP